MDANIGSRLMPDSMGNIRSVTCVISSNVTLNCTLATEVIHSDTFERYDGTYVVEPTFEEQTLETANKLLTDDVTVNAIEVQRVSNPSGGKTVYIGGNVNG